MKPLFLTTVTKSFFLLTVLTALLISCSKNNSAPGTTTVTPEEFDTLAPGWQAIQIDASIDLNDVFFLNSSTGFTCGAQYLGKSTNGGLTWTNILPDSLKQNFSNLFFVDVNNGWAAGDKFLLHTTNGGASWQKIYSGGQAQIFDMQFFDANNGYLLSLYNNRTLKTNDGGVTNSLTGSSNSGGIYQGLFFLNQATGWISNQASILKTTDGGVTYSTLSANPFPNNNANYIIQFTDNLHGWLAGTSIFRTIDGGNNFDLVSKGESQSGGDIAFFDNNNGYILSGYCLYSTNDGGKTLNKLITIRKSNFFECHFTDPDHGWIAGTKGYIYRYVKP